MKLKKLYSLRKDFTVIGLTGRVGSGCSEIAEKLSNSNFINSINITSSIELDEAEMIKNKICYDFLSNSNNWLPFKIIHYKDVLLFHLIFESTRGNNLDESIDNILEIVFQNGESENKDFTNRFDKIGDVKLKEELTIFLKKNTVWFDYSIDELICDELNSCLNLKKQDIDLYGFYFDYFEGFSKDFFKLLNKNNITKRSRLVHDLANNLRDSGSVVSQKRGVQSLENIYIVAETINRLIKNWRSKEENVSTKIVIDSLKNSLELMYFKEKYSAFYMLASNKSEKERKNFVLEKIKKEYSTDYSTKEIEKHSNELLKLDDTEYDGKDVNGGGFSSPDIENCIQKSDYHIFFSNKEMGIKDLLDASKSKSEVYDYLSLERQLVRLIALIHQPGIVTPSAIERTMQVAYNAKFNSGCISRQVGAVITDSNFSVKSIGWNDVPQNQIPCNLRNANDLIDSKNENLFSDFENGIDELGMKYKDGETFKSKITKEYNGKKTSKDDLEGRNCSFCFKTLHNAFEGEKNQVHTRSLHAEENAMMQIIKYGGQSMKGGNLFTTASPCELCSKKAFQLGIKNIYFIDPYPGIATKHILKGGVNKDDNPKLMMFQGAVGRAFHKLYEPFLAYKDELRILTDINPDASNKLKIQNLTKDKELRQKIENLIIEHTLSK